MSKDKDWDVGMATELCKAMQACQSIEKLNDIAKGIALLSSNSLSDERRDWLRTIYISCKNSLKPDTTPKDLFKKNPEKT